jgi:4-amino-4-deoxy-L-arabinose transferase-like glycosyltransferase
MGGTKAAARAWWPLALLALWLLATLSVRPLLLPDEGRYTGVAREMLLGDGLTPTLNGLPYFHKPPLMYWLDMAAMSVLGVGQWAVRFGPALGAFVMGAALFLHLRRTHGDAVARTGLALLATMPLFFIGAQYANHDMGVAGFITLAVFSLLRAVEIPGRRALRWQVLGGAACGLAVLSKGLIGVVLPVAVVAPWLLAQGRWRCVLALLHPAGVAALLAVALPWMLLMQHHHPGFFDYFIVEQHFRRFAGTHFNNAQPWWFFIAVLPLLTLPWIGLLWAAVRRAWLRRHDPALWFPVWLPVWWIVVIVGFFSLPHSKLVGYVMPAMAPLVMLLAPVLVAWPRLLRWLLPTTALALLGVVAALALAAPGSHRDVARALAPQLGAGDRVVYIDEYFFDFALYAGLREPVFVVSDWADPELPLNDNWRKELFDAAKRFGTPAQARVLWPEQRDTQVLCHDKSVWLVVPHVHAARVGAWPGVSLVLRGKNAQLMRAPPRACAAPP